MTERRRGETRESGGTEEVPASEVALGDEIFFPNSRKASAVVTRLVANDGNIALWSDDAQWTVPDTFTVRRVKKEN